MGIKIKLSLLFIFTLIINACLPRPEAELQRTQTSITLKGKIENSRGLPASRTAIYIEQSNSPEVLSAEDGSFYISLDAHKIAELRLQYGIKNKNIRLYFVQSDGLTESTMIPCINFFDLGVQDLGLVQLSVDRTVKGRVLAMSTPEGMLKPVKDARVKIGREEVLSNENGEFSTKIASNVSLPILIERTAYVQSQANWTYNSEDPCRD
ncbi:MAG: hypothetical protein NTX25_03315, partial [Proteobacteria bacterium]|nr:hypothetical protein [Pseudomonadota bacterium]